VGVWNSPADLDQVRLSECRFEPSMPDSRREELYGGWLRAVERVRSEREGARDE
jgi:glycerol kinase